MLKSKTMYLSVMPAGARPPDQLLKSLKYQPTPDSEVQLAQWVMVRERSLDRLRQRQRSSQSLRGLTAGDSVDLDVSAGPLSPSSRRLMLFFQVNAAKLARSVGGRIHRRNSLFPPSRNVGS